MYQDKLFDRKDTLEIIHKRVLSFTQGYRQNIAILGNELVGKTSTIKSYLNNQLPKEIIPLYISVEPKGIDYFTKRFCQALLYNFLKSKEIKSPSYELDYLISNSETFIPQTVGKIKEIISNLERQKFDLVFEMLFDLPGNLTKETQKKCIVVFDEFHHLEDFAVKDIFKELAKVIMLEKDTMYLLLSSFRLRAKKVLENQLSLLFGNFETIEMEAFDYRACDEFILGNLVNIHILPVYREFIINLSGGIPYYLDIFAQELLFLSKLKEKTELSLEDIIEALSELLFNSLGRLYTILQGKLSEVISSKNNSYLDVLLAIADGVNKLKDITTNLKRPKKDILHRLNKLIEFNLISQNGAFYKINDRLFSFWLKAVYKLKHNLPEEDLDTLKGLFQRELKNLFNILLEESRKKSTERIIELFNLFKDDSVQLGRRRLKLTDFKETKFISFGNDDLRMIIVAKDKEDTFWIIFLKEDIISEEDILEFSKRLKKDEPKIKRKIIISLSQIEHNARLKALEEKMLIWDLKNINQLFEFYGKPMIVR